MKLLDHRITADPATGSFTHSGTTYTGKVIGRWRLEGRWFADNQDRNYVRIETSGGEVADLYQTANGWFLERWHE